MESKAVRPEALENLLETLKADYRRLMVTTNNSWRTPQEREEARQVLAKSIKNASAAVQSVEGTQDAELRRWHNQLVIEVTLADDAVKHPNTLRR